ncbi:MAG: sulfatase-like hydrolase/transferase, partial [Planctomycetaceae bacterium]|nr:sulfatase-like hydrolase/transferase [Planctomycetaceae bacterium]
MISDFKSHCYQLAACTAVFTLLVGLETSLLLAQADGRTEGGLEPPNILILFTDDQGYGDLGCYGSEINKTPRLDQLAEEG